VVFKIYFGSVSHSKRSGYAIQKPLGAILFALIGYCTTSNAQAVRDTFPTPPANKDMLFYVQRSTNISTIIYELNRNSDGTVNSQNPVHIFWIRYSEDGAREELSHVQRNFAYGLNIKPVASNSYELSFVSYKKLKMLLEYVVPEKRYHVYTQVGDNRILVNRFFVKVGGGTFWVPKIDYVEISGVIANSGNEFVERFNP
jgi:hypothetical protein